MGFSISWIGCRALDTAKMLRDVNMHVTTKPDPFNEAPYSFAEMPGGWSILFANDDITWGDFEHLAVLSANREILGMVVEEHTDIWALYAYANGKPLWYVVRETTTGPSLLHSGGTVPEVAKPFLAPAWRAQEERDNAAFKHYPSSEPVDIGEAITGYRHDRYGREGDRRFHVLEKGFEPDTGL
jgi:hypothetical protein